ncbi:MAG TPA: hypothetical protein VFA59_05695 [Vicinamibacterales bacterium]|nr:hypothetical protein [Vicinamibacterales bacterium]
MNRRELIAALTVAPAFGRAKALAAGNVADTFPMQDRAMVQEMVVVSHFNARRVRELVDAHPALARAAMDWGFGDWEDALGAASHVGNREIADYLLSHGARPTIFSAAMLGQLDVVKAFVTVNPGAQRIAGPHSIHLLAHAKAGGAAAKPVYDYLLGLGDANGPAVEPISDDEKAALAGTYTFGSGAADRVVITVDKGALMFNRPGMPYARGLLHLGRREFFPMGASAVRITFDAGPRPATVTVRDGDVVVVMSRYADR